MEKSESKGIVVGFNVPKAILRFAEIFSSPVLSLLQAVQNSLDANATFIIVEIHCHNLLPKRKSKKEEDVAHNQSRIMVYDNGTGVGEEEMVYKVSHFCESLKNEDENALGQYGTGFLAGLGFGKKHSFTTKDPKTGLFFSIELDKDEIVKLGETGGELIINFKKVANPNLLGMTTLVATKGVSQSTLRVLTANLKDLAQEVADRFGHKIIEQNAKITIRHFVDNGVAKGLRAEIPVEGFNFPGESKEPVNIETKFGKVRFEMNFAPIAQKETKILIRVKGKETFPMSKSILLALMEKSRGLLTSGHIHGIIISGFGSETTGKNDFAEGEEKDAFIEAIETFCEKYGSVWEKQIVKAAQYEPIFKEVVSSLLKVCKTKPDIVPVSLGGVVSDGHIGANAGDGVKLLLDKIGVEDSLISSETDGVVLLNGATVKQKNKPKSEKPMEHVNVQNSGQGKKRVSLPEQPGLTVLLADGSKNHPGQRSWVENGVVYISCAHTSFDRAYNRGRACFGQYIEQLVVWEIYLAGLKDKSDFTQSAMRQRFKEMMNLFEMFLFGV